MLVRGAIIYRRTWPTKSPDPNSMGPMWDALGEWVTGIVFPELAKSWKGYPPALDQDTNGDGWYLYWYPWDRPLCRSSQWNIFFLQKCPKCTLISCVFLITWHTWSIFSFHCVDIRRLQNQTNISDIHTIRKVGGKPLYITRNMHDTQL